MSPLGLGTVKLGRDRGLKYPGPARLPSDDEALALLQAAKDLGINLIDTAPAYGLSEERLGTLWPRVWSRDQLVLCTKVGEVFDAASEVSTYDFTPSHIRASVERSRRLLGVSVLDVVLLHFRSSDDLDERTLRAGGAMGTLRELQARGVIRAVGASIGTRAGGLLAAEVCDVVMLTLQASAAGGLTGDVDVLAACRERGAGVLVKKALASGHGAVPPAQAIVRVLSEPGVHAAVVGTGNPVHLRELVAAAGA